MEEWRKRMVNRSHLTVAIKQMLCGYSWEQCRLITVPNYFVDLQHHLNKINRWKVIKIHIQPIWNAWNVTVKRKKKKLRLPWHRIERRTLRMQWSGTVWHLELQSHALPLSYQGFESRTSGRPGADLLKTWIKPELDTVPEVIMAVCTMFDCRINLHQNFDTVSSYM